MLLAPILLATSLCAGDAPYSASTADVIPGGTHVGAVPYGESSLQLFETTRNKVPNVLKRFAYEPAFAPVLDAAKHIAFKGPLAIKVSGPDQISTPLWQISLALRFSTPELDELALNEARAHLEGDREAISPRNIRVWPIKWLRVSLPEDVVRRFPSMHLARSTFNLNTAKSVEIKFWFDDEKTATDIAADIDAIELDLMYAQDGAHTESLSVGISTKIVKASGMYDELKDLGSDLIYLRRSDVKELLARLRITTAGGRELENPERFDQTLFSTLMRHWELQLGTFDVTHFDEEMIQHTWRLKDLDPHSLKKYFSRNFRVEHDIVHVKNDADAHASGKLDLLGVLAASGGLRGSYKTDEFRDILKQHDIIVEFEGEFVIPKKITLYLSMLGSSMQNSPRHGRISTSRPRSDNASRCHPPWRLEGQRDRSFR